MFGAKEPPKARHCFWPLAALATSTLASPAFAQDSQPQPSAAQTVEVAAAAEAPLAAESKLAQPYSLSKDLGITGVSVKLEGTGFVGGMVSGEGDDGVKVTGRGDLYLDFSSDGLGLWKGGLLRTHTELRYSSNRSGSFGGALWPSNTAAVAPITGEGIELSSLHLAQKLGPKTMVLVGKINAFDLLASDPFFGGLGTKRFQNVAFVAPPSGVVPPTIMGAVLTHKIGQVGITAMAFDPKDRTGQYWVKDLFKTGVNLSLGVSWGGEVAGRPTSIGITGTYSTERGTNFDSIFAPPGLETSTKKGSYNIAVQVGHQIAASKVLEGKGLGVYLKAAIADGNPNAIQGSVIGGLAAHGMISSRPYDSFGLGMYYYNFSNALQDAVSPLIEFNDEVGAEAWYSFAITPNVFLSGDVQWINPANGERPNVVVIGGRLHLSI